jgi:hypothetical protein
MRDQNYWKRRYRGIWRFSIQREQKVLNLLDEKGIKAEFSGFGTGNDSFISGSPSEYGLSKGDPDIHICNTNIYIEVTGTNSNKVDEKSPLWIRPDKIENALKSSEKDVWIVHVLDRFDLIRCIHLKKEICEILLNRNRSIKKIRGSSETYIEILANEDIVKPIDELLNYIKPKLGL